MGCIIRHRPSQIGWFTIKSIKCIQYSGFIYLMYPNSRSSNDPKNQAHLLMYPKCWYHSKKWHIWIHRVSGFILRCILRFSVWFICTNPFRAYPSMYFDFLEGSKDLLKEWQCSTYRISYGKKISSHFFETVLETKAYSVTVFAAQTTQTFMVLLTNGKSCSVNCAIHHSTLEFYLSVPTFTLTGRFWKCAITKWLFGGNHIV